MIKGRLLIRQVETKVRKGKERRRKREKQVMKATLLIRQVEG